MDADARCGHSTVEHCRFSARMAGLPAVDQLTERPPLESGDQRREAFFAAFEIDPVPEPRDGVDAVHVRLPGIDFPWMQIEDVRTSRTQDRTHSPAPHSVRDEAKIPAASPGDPVAAHSHAGNSGFVEIVTESDDRPTRIHTVQPAVAVMGDGRHEGRVVLESRILQDGNGPIRDRETRRAIAPDWLAGQILEMVLRTQDVVTKRAR